MNCLKKATISTKKRPKWWSMILVLGAGGDNVRICWEMGKMMIFQLLRGPVSVVFSVSMVFNFKCPHKLKLVVDFDSLRGTLLTVSGEKLWRWFDIIFGPFLSQINIRKFSPKSQNPNFLIKFDPSRGLFFDH